MRLPRTGLWRHSDFLRLWSGQTISEFGSLVGGAALQFTAILVLDASPLQVAVLAASTLVPGFLLGLRWALVIGAGGTFLAALCLLLSQVRNVVDLPDQAATT